MTIGRRAVLSWGAVLGGALVAAACAADPGDGPKGDDAAPVTVEPSSGSSTSTSTSTSGGTGTGTSTPPPTTSDDADAPLEAAVPDDAVPVEAGPPGPSSCPTCPLALDYECMQTGASTSEIAPWYEIVNQGTSPQPLSELTVRYWFDSDASSGSTPLQYVCDYAQVGVAGGSTMAITGAVTATFGAAATPTAGADSYMEIAFSAAAGSIPPGLNAQIQNRFHKNGYSGQFVQTGDYSFNPAATTYAPSSAITVYRNGTLVWGTEPGGAAAPTADP